VTAEILGVAGFTLTAPAAYLVSGGSSARSALILWLVAFGFFAGSIFSREAPPRAIEQPKGY